MHGNANEIIAVVSSKKVHFDVQRLSRLTTGSTMTFDIATVNAGANMNISSGIFTAPVPGNYHFTYFGPKAIMFKLNNQGLFWQSQTATNSIGNFFVSNYSVRMIRGDTANVYPTNLELAPNSPPIRVSGWLVEDKIH